MNKKILALVLALVCMMAVTACGSSSSDNDLGVVSSGELHMATNATFPPYESVNDDGTYAGIDIEIAQAIADKLDLTLVVDDMEFSSIITSVQSGKADIAMAGLTVTEERSANVDFTTSYATGIQVIIVPEGSSITSVDDLDGAIIGCQEGTTGYIYCCDDYGDENVIGYTNGATAIQALLTGKVDAVVIDNQPAQEYVKASDGLVILDTAYVEEEYAIGVSKDNAALYEAISTALQELIDDGTVQAIIDSYIVAE